ncbi:MAG TPA: quinolinate synthase NadA, partial [Limnochordia bacterium]|nr:quinolinate synthase NadA [Limnochordia bacterium]
TKMVSTSGMIEHVKKSPRDTFIVATEVGILHRMRKDNPHKTFIPASESAVCPFMKKITLPKVYRSLAEDVFRVTVPAEIAGRARGSIDRMLAIS